MKINVIKTPAARKFMSIAMLTAATLGGAKAMANPNKTQDVLPIQSELMSPLTAEALQAYSAQAGTYSSQRNTKLDEKYIALGKASPYVFDVEKEKAEIADLYKELGSFGASFVLQNEKSDSEDEEILVEMKNVNVGWDGRLVLENLNWTLKKHEHWLIRGPNGCGKTTFLELITGDNKQVYSNDIWIFGIKRGSGESIWDIKKRLGIVSYRLHVEYRMIGGISLQNVIISGFRDSIGLYGEATDVEKDAAKKWLKLGGFINRENELFSNLSYGEQRAILILRAAVKCPEILILDEPTAGLDPEGREEILQNIEDYRKAKNATIMMVSHSMNDVARLTDRLLVMRDASLAMDGTPDAVFARAEELVEMGLDIPELTRVFMKLQQLGLDVKPIYTMQQAVDALRSLKGGAVDA